MTPLFASRFALDPERSFERLYRKHVRDVYAFSLGMLSNPDDAEDVTQTTFMNAYRALARGDGIDNPRAWLLKIAHNVCRQRFRTAARRPQEVELGHELAEAFTEDEPPAADEIRAALKHLAFNQRTVLVLREIEGLSYAEISETMGITPSAVETLLFRARRALREQLEAAERPLACPDAEVFISRQLDGRLSRRERGQLRAHLRACPACAAYARSQRAQRKAMRALAGVPLPFGLAQALGSSLGGGIAAKAAAVAAG
ncbi:MAG TPA: sigma-70 family RNA polymerase sigma factor, partial [Gaiellaceae bacterium]|nr:sigma-70 family RNA polymerase sigma factor [Gaiellaceae bacterium]